MGGGSRERWPKVSARTPDYDYAILGQGLAGTLLAWHLHWRGRRVVLLDRDAPVTASKIAAGLLNPITGQRPGLSWRLEEFLPAAEGFYRSVEGILGERILHSLPMVRLLQDAEAVRRWCRIAGMPAVRRHLSDPQPEPLVDPERVHPGAGGFEISSSHVLDVPRFLQESRRVLEVRRAEIDVAGAVIPGADSVRIRMNAHTLVARRLVFCQGPDARRGNPWFDWVPFRCAKGEILEVNCPALCGEQRVLNGAAWLAPVPGGVPGTFRAGSTYAHDDLTPLPTNAGRAAIEARLRTLLKGAFEVTGHVAAIRPIIHRSRALIGMHPSQPRIGFFNGLGSKGSLNGPCIAGKFAAFLEEGVPVEDAFDLLQNL